jgi:hypothetical protein
MSKLSTLVIVVSTALGAGCAGGTSGGVYASGGYASGGYSAGVYGSTPPLVEVSPDVWVIEGYNEPVFYSDNYYWLYRNGVWMRSSYYTGGWVTVRTLPYRLRTIHTPYAYVRYRAPYGARFRQGPQGRVIIRDHRDPYAINRERREDQRERVEDRQERREDFQERREDQRERVEDRQERREDQRERVEDRQERREDAQQNRQDARERQQKIQENRQEAREQQRKRDRRNKKN